MPDNNHVQLDTFVATAISQIVRGLAEAEKEIATLGGHINPPVMGGSTVAATAGRQITITENDYRSITTIDFDIAVTAEATAGRKSGIAVVFAAISGGTQESKTLLDRSVSRIQFSVPVLLPPGGKLPPPKPRKPLRHVTE
jgi:hypothetical protein